MSNRRIDSKADVELFLAELKMILESDTFVVKRDLDILMKKKGEDPKDPCTTANTMATLEYDKNDVYEELKKLTIREYAETIIYDRDSTWPPFFVFYRNIQSQNVYIKVKIRDRQSGKVFCVSFHFARYPVTNSLPYAN